MRGTKFPEFPFKECHASHSRQEPPGWTFDPRQQVGPSWTEQNPYLVRRLIKVVHPCNKWSVLGLSGFTRFTAIDLTYDQYREL
ncbi:Putative neurobeachin-like protein [Frankliniella fusca]|uniref:Neurobeachin-like protein n=1 Tax=Frankliniella fusca TaxID=407009 RepID=A0AAE1LMN8_9NEOP|nr:Putative neurobeachin-like protein [Frankliniella fusca]